MSNVTLISKINTERYNKFYTKRTNSKGTISTSDVNVMSVIYFSVKVLLHGFPLIEYKVAYN